MLYTINFLIFKLFRAKKNHENALDLFVLFSFPWRCCCCMVDAEWSTAWLTPLSSSIDHAADHSAPTIYQPSICQTTNNFMELYMCVKQNTLYHSS